MSIQIRNPEQIKTTEDGVFNFTLEDGTPFAKLSGNFSDACRTAKTYYMRDKQTKFGIINVERVTKKEPSG